MGYKGSWHQRQVCHCHVREDFPVTKKIGVEFEGQKALLKKKTRDRYFRGRRKKNPPKLGGGGLSKEQ